MLIISPDYKRFKLSLSSTNPHSFLHDSEDMVDVRMLGQFIDSTLYACDQLTSLSLRR